MSFEDFYKSIGTDNNDVAPANTNFKKFYDNIGTSQAGSSTTGDDFKTFYNNINTDTGSTPSTVADQQYQSLVDNQPAMDAYQKERDAQNAPAQEDHSFMGELKHAGQQWLGAATAPVIATGKFVDRATKAMVAGVTPTGPDFAKSDGDIRNIFNPTYSTGPTAHDEAVQRLNQADLGNGFANKAADLVGGAMGYVGNPAMMGIPGAGVGNFFENSITQRAAAAAGQKLQGALPSAGLTLSKDGTRIVDSLLGKTVNQAAQGAVKGGIGGAAYAPFNTMTTSDNLGDIPRNIVDQGLQGAEFGGAFGAVSPALGAVFKSIFSKPGQLTPSDTFNQAAQARNAIDVNGANPAARQAADRFRFIDNQANAYGSKPLALPENEAFRRSQGTTLPPNTDPIYAKGDIYTPPILGLPEGNYVAPTRLKLQNPEQAFRSAYEKVLPKAVERMTPPLENPNELAKWVQGHMNDHGYDVSLNEVRKLDYNSLQQLAGEVKTRMNPLDVVTKTANDMGYGRIFAKDQTLAGKIASDAQQRAYGVYPENLPSVKEPHLNSRVTGEALAPLQKVGFKRETLRTAKQDAGSTVQSTKYAKGEAAIPTAADGTHISEPQKIVDVQSKNGANYYRFENSKTYMPEHRVQRAETMGAPKAAEKPVQPLRGEAANVPETSQAYAGNSMSFREAPLQGERTISRDQVVRNMRQNLGVVIDTGRLSSKGRGVLGEFKVTPEVIRSRMLGDLQTISHEIGHNLDKRFKLQEAAYEKELIDMVNKVNPDHLGNYPAGKHLEEAIAEYVRLRLTDPAQAKALAPNFTRFFESKLDKKALNGLEASQKDVNTWITQGEYAQAKGLIDFTSGSKKEGFVWGKEYAKYVDDLNYLKIAEKALKGKIGLGSESIYKMARLSRGMEERAKLAIDRGIYINGKKVSDGLSEIVKPLESMGIKEPDFATYLSVLHAQDLKAMGKQVPFTDAQMKAVMNRLDSPELRAVQQKVVGFNNGLLDTLVDAQILSKQAVADMQKKYPNYVPFMRYFDDDAVAGFKNGGFGAAKGFANIANPIKKMSEEGSLRTVINPIESIIKNTFLVMNAAAKNKVGLQLVKLSKIDGAGAWVEHIGEGGASPHEHIVSVYENGVRQSYKIREPELYNAMLSLDAESSNSLIRFLGGVAGLLRGGATLTPDFMVRNVFRDVAGAMVNSTKYGFNPIDFAKGMFHVLGKTDTLDQFLSHGGAMSTMMSLDRDVTRETLKSVFRESLKDKALNVVTSPRELAKMLSGYTPVKKTIGMLRKGAEISELSTKVGAFSKTLKKTGSLEEAAYTARDLMDFNRAGSAIRPANKAVAFLNASIQGTDRMARAFQDNKAGFLVRAFTTLVLPSVGLYYWNNSLDGERKAKYDNIPQWQKDSFFIIPIPGTTEFARIPKPFEAGMLFATGADRILRWVDGNDPKAFKDYGSTLLQSFTPPMMISALTPLLEAITNHSIFRNAPIVPMGEQRREKQDQYGMFTSETAKLFGKLAAKTPLKDSNAASPRIIDNTIKGYTAGLGQYAVAGADKLITSLSGKDRPTLPAKSITEQPLLRSFIATTSGGGQVRQDFYDKWSKLSAAKSSADFNGKRFTDPAYGPMKGAEAIITNLNKQYKTVQASKTISPQDKRRKLDELDSRMNRIAGDVLKKVGAK
jgi:hypothetical protein